MENALDKNDNSSSRKLYLSRSPVLCSDCGKRLKVFKRKKKCIVCYGILCRHCFPHHLATCEQSRGQQEERSKHRTSLSAIEQEGRRDSFLVLDDGETQQDVYFKSPREDQSAESPSPLENLTEPTEDIRVRKLEKYGGSTREDFAIEQGQNEYREAIILQKVITCWTQKRVLVLDEVEEHQTAQKQRSGNRWRDAEDEVDVCNFSDTVASVLITLLVWIVFAVFVYVYIIFGRTHTAAMLS
uniref:AlNc14C96G5873 protein n=1 Tax=Albugo laibachii Nc14 TaxID=890382 RepID=F0WGZ8_9STRA|nr:AlNc14C96G5873 [Albugo laibachii Nc14]|eukprot:CCA20513.1 AlNc14C96G5873 [Albugo laibachii Nc14]